MDANGLNKVIEQIRRDYLLIAKGKLWMIFGGFIGALTAAGLISYGSAKAVLESSTTGQVETEIHELYEQAKSDVKEIGDIRLTLGEPPGTILPFGGVAGLDDPVGYMPCDGRQVKREKYRDLFTAIGTAWGEGDGSTTFNVPDLRGYFLRGTDDRAHRDPDVADRTAIARGGNTGDNVGSIQPDQFGEHKHTGAGNHKHFWRGYRACGSGDRVVRSKAWIDRDPLDTITRPGGDGDHNHGPQGGNETRPKNAYVNFIIKY